jgi:hypothetical protein
MPTSPHHYEKGKVSQIVVLGDGRLYPENWQAIVEAENQDESSLELDDGKGTTQTQDSFHWFLAHRLYVGLRG